MAKKKYTLDKNVPITVTTSTKGKDFIELHITTQEGNIQITMKVGHMGGMAKMMTQIANDLGWRDDVYLDYVELN